MNVRDDKNDVMINLLDLQEEIDELLEKETDESLLNWYNNFQGKKKSAMESYMGEGDFFSVNSGVIDYPDILKAEKPTYLEYEPQCSNVGNTQYAMAA